MIPFERTRQQTIPNSAVKVIGVGGAGANMLDRIALDGMDGAELLAVNTDVRTLTSSVAAEKIQLGRNLTKGLGTGGDPELGKQAAAEAELEIRDALRDRKIVFICVGLGGGTGSGAAPLLTRLAREQGAFTVVFATMPFSFEGHRRKEQAEAALTEISALSNALVTFDNTRMGELVLAKQGVHEAFAAADRMVSESIKAVTRIVLRPGLVNIGLDDLVSALSSNKSRCLFGSGIAEGENRAQKALKNALVSPLLDRGSLLNDATAVLVHICGGEDLTLYEIELLMRGLSKHVPESAQLLFGTAVDPAMGESLSVTLVSSLPAEKLLEGVSSDETMAPPPRAEEPLKDPRMIDEPADEPAAPPESSEPEATVARMAAAAAPVTPRAVEAPPAKAEAQPEPKAAPAAVAKPVKLEPPAEPVEEPGAKAAPAPGAKKPAPAAKKTAPAIEAKAPARPAPAGKAGGAKTPSAEAKAAPPVAGKATPPKVKVGKAAPPKEAPKLKAPKAAAPVAKKAAKPEALKVTGDPPPPSRPPSPEVAAKLQAEAKKGADLGDLESLDAPAREAGPASGVEPAKPDMRTRRVKLPPKRQGAKVREVQDVYEGASEERPEGAKVPALPPVPPAKPTDEWEELEPAPAKPAAKGKGGPAIEEDGNVVAFETIEPGTGGSSARKTSIEELQAAADFDPKSQTELLLEGGPKGRFEGEEPNIIDGEDLDVPPFLRRKE